MEVRIYYCERTLHAQLLCAFAIYAFHPNMADSSKVTSLHVILRKRQHFGLLTAINISPSEPAHSVILRLRSLYFDDNLCKRVFFTAYRTFTSLEVAISVMNLSEVSIYFNA